MNEQQSERIATSLESIARSLRLIQDDLSASYTLGDDDDDFNFFEALLTAINRSGIMY